MVWCSEVCVCVCVRVFVCVVVGGACVDLLILFSIWSYGGRLCKLAFKML